MVKGAHQWLKCVSNLPRVSHLFARAWSLSGFSAQAKPCLASFVKDAAYNENVEQVTISLDVAYENMSKACLMKKDWKRTVTSFELVSMHSFKHVSRKSTWSRRSWSTVSTLPASSFPSSLRQLGSSTSNVANARICWMNASMRARSRNTRRRQFSKSACQSNAPGAGVGGRDEPALRGVSVRHGAVLWSDHMFVSDCSTCLRCSRKRKMSWYRRMVLREMTSESGNLTW